MANVPAGKKKSSSRWLKNKTSRLQPASPDSLLPSEPWQLAFATTHQGYWNWTYPHAFIQASPYFFQLIGLPVPKTGRLSLPALKKFILPKDRPLLFDQVNQPWKKTPNFEFECRVKHPTQGNIWVLVRGKVLVFNPKRQPAQIIGTFLNISERKHQEELLRLQRDLATGLSDSPDLAATLSVCLQTTLHATGWESAAVYLLDSNHSLSLAQYQGLPRLVLKNFNSFKANSPQVKITLAKQPIYYNRQQIRALPLALAHKLKLQSLAILPLYHQDSILGTLVAFSSTQASIAASLHSVLESIATQTSSSLQRNRIETHLRESQERMELVLWGGDLGFLDVHVLTGKTVINHQLKNMLGYDADEIFENNPDFLRDLLHPADWPRHLVMAKTILQNKRSLYELELRVRCKSREYKWVLIKAKVVGRDAKKYPTRITGTVLDITPLKLAELALQYEKEKAHTFLNLTSVFLVALHRNGRVLFINQKGIEILGLPDKKIIGQNWFTNFIPPSHLPKIQAIFRQLFQGHHQKHEYFEYPILPKSGKARLIAWHTALLKNSSGAIYAVLSSGEDITERKKAEVKLLQTKEITEASNRELENAIRTAQQLAQKASSADAAKSQFIANVSHEIRTPMNSIIGFADMLLDSELSDEQRQFVTTILASTELLMTLINDILDLSKVEAGQMEIEAIPFNLESLLLDASELVRAKIGEKPIEIHCDLDQAPSLVIGSPNRLRQVLVNLLGNAVKFTQCGEIVTSLAVLAHEPHRIHMAFTIRDTGIGISEDKVQAIFEPFTQADGSFSRIYGGTGLGLTITRKLLQLMQGEISLQTQIGVGSTFCFSLWFALPDEIITKTTRETPPEFSQLKLLAIDDNPTALTILAKHTSELGMQCQTAATWDQGIALLQQTAFDFILIDLHLPELNLPQLHENLRKISSLQIPRLIGMSAHPFRERNQNLITLFDGIVNKPFRKTALTAMLRSLLGLFTLESKQSRLLHLSQTPVSRIRILLAEDNKSNQQIIVKMLERLGHAVDVADDGVIAVEKALSKTYQLVFMDMQMPKLNGLEATRRLRQQGLTSLPIIALTANAMQGDREKCLQAGMTDYLSKPVKRNDIVQVLKRYAGIENIPEMNTTLRILIAEPQAAQGTKVAAAFQQAFPLAICRTTASGIEAGILLGSFLPDLIIINMELASMDPLALIQYVKAEFRYLHCYIIVTNARILPKEKVLHLRNLGVAVVHSPVIPPAKLVEIAHHLCSNSYILTSLEIVGQEPESDFTETISEELGISIKDFKDILEIFFRNTPEKIKSLEQALIAKNLQRASELAHSIKSSSLSLRLHTVADPASRLEKLAQAEKYGEIKAYFHMLQNAFKILQQNMDPTLADKPTAPPGPGPDAPALKPPI